MHCLVLYRWQHDITIHRFAIWVGSRFEFGCTTSPRFPGMCSWRGSDQQYMPEMHQWLLVAVYTRYLFDGHLLVDFLFATIFILSSSSSSSSFHSPSITLSLSSAGVVACQACPLFSDSCEGNEINVSPGNHPPLHTLYTPLLHDS